MKVEVVDFRKDVDYQKYIDFTSILEAADDMDAPDTSKIPQSNIVDVQQDGITSYKSEVETHEEYIKMYDEDVFDDLIELEILWLRIHTRSI